MSKISQIIEQKQKLSPRQILEANILQLNSFNLEKRILKELEDNPTLEAIDDELDNENDEYESSNDKEEDDFDSEDFESNFGSLDYSAKNRNDYVESLSDFDDKNLTKDILTQLHDINFSEDDEKIALEVLGNLDEKGFLNIETILIADKMNVNEEKVNQIVSQIQLLDPPGIASKTIQECIVAQIKRFYPKNEFALSVIENYFNEFINKKFEQIINSVKCKEEDIINVIDVVASLNPNPAINYINANNNHLVPDVIAEKIDGLWVVNLNELPYENLKINRYYEKLAKKHSKDKEVNKFLKNKIQSANWFINAIRQRTLTIKKVVKTIIDLQDEYFNSDKRELKPMILKDVASKISMDISTVSRVTKGKYIQLPWGVKELKSFFSESVKMNDGDMVSNTILKKELINLISLENKRQPYTDDELTSMLNKQGFNIARRTVAKYREMLKFPTSKLRKTLL